MRKCYRDTGLLLLLLLHFTAVSQTPDTLRLDLEAAVNRALLENLNLEQTKLEVEQAENETALARGNYLPALSFNGNYTRNIKRPVFFLPEGAGFPGGGGVIEVGFDNSFLAAIEGSLPIFDKRLLKGIKIARIGHQIAGMNLASEINELKAQVKQTFLNALIAKELVLVQLMSLENAILNLRDIRNQYEQGIIAEYDFIRARVNVENIRPGVVEARNNYNSAVNQLKLLTNIPAGQPVELLGTNVGYYRSVRNVDLKEFSVEGNPSLKTVALQVRLRLEEVSFQQAAFYPALSGFGNYQFQGQENHFDLTDYRWVNTSAVGINLSYSVFQGLIRRQRVQQAEIGVIIAEKQYDYLYNSLEVQAENALQRLLLAQTSIDAQEDNVDLAEKAYEIAQISYMNGLIRYIELLDAEFALTEARINFVAAINEFLLALIEYERIIGRDIVEISR